MAHPGKKLLFMGGEFGQFSEWNEETSLDWQLVEEYDMHRRLQKYTRALNNFYVLNKELWQVDFDKNGFQWIESNDNDNSVISFIRKGIRGSDYVIIISNFSREEQEEYRLGVPESGSYEEVFNTDKAEYGGKGIKNGLLEAEEKVYHNRSHSIRMRIAPLSTIYLKHVAW